MHGVSQPLIRLQMQVPWLSQMYHLQRLSNIYCLGRLLPVLKRTAQHDHPNRLSTFPIPAIQLRETIVHSVFILHSSCNTEWTGPVGSVESVTLLFIRFFQAYWWNRIQKWRLFHRKSIRPVVLACKVDQVSYKFTQYIIMRFLLLILCHFK